MLASGGYLVFPMQPSAEKKLTTSPFLTSALLQEMAHARVGEGGY